MVQEVVGLRRRLATQPVIEQAKGLLIGFYGVDADVAFAVLVRWSQHTNVRLHALATDLVAAASQPSAQPLVSLRSFIDQLAGQASAAPLERAEEQRERFGRESTGSRSASAVRDHLPATPSGD